MAVPMEANKFQKQGAKKLRSILFDTTTALTLTPIQVLVFSLSFMIMVFMLHAISRMFPFISFIQIFISVLVVMISIGVSIVINKK